VELHVSEFLDRLYESPREWIVDPKGRLSLTIWNGGKADVVCPFTFVRDYDNGKIRREFGELRLYHYTELRRKVEVLPRHVFDAADNVKGHAPKIRQALFLACNPKIVGGV
jgi:hypothetical protein